MGSGGRTFQCGKKNCEGVMGLIREPPECDTVPARVARKLRVGVGVSDGDGLAHVQRHGCLGG